jgi:RNA-directed DNA polymerase
LKVVQWWILDTVLSNTYIEPFVYGFVRGRNFIQNARAHIGCSHILNVDVKDFFDSVLINRVASTFEALGYSGTVSEGMAKLVTLSDRLPQGAPTSPMLANLAFSRTDVELKQMAEGIGVKYTRYADDMTFSSKKRLDPELPNIIQRIILRQGFSLNEKKTRFMGPSQRKDVTGVVVTDSGVKVPHPYPNAARGWFHSAASDPHLFLASEHRIRGTIELIKQIGGRGSTKVIALGEQAVQKIAEIRLEQQQ